MARLRRGSPPPTTIDERVDRLGLDGDRFEAGPVRPAGRHGDPGGRKADRRPDGGPAAEPGVDLDAAVDAVLAAGGVDAVTRVRLTEARRAMGRGGRAGDPTGFEGANLSQALYRFVMPRLQNPEVLRADRHRALLEGLADGLARTDEDGVVRTGTLIVRRELRRLAQLRAARNALIEG